MITHAWRYAVDIVREDSSSVRQVEVAPDWDPVCECLWFTALRQGSPPAAAFALDCELEPIWHRRRAEPYIEGVRARAYGPATSSISLDVTTECFLSPARAAITRLVEDGTLAEGDLVRFLPMAFARNGASTSGQAPPRFTTRTVPPPLAVGNGSLNALLARSSGPVGDADHDEDDAAVVLPQPVIDEVVELTRLAAGAFETGGLLLGQLQRDVGGAGIYVEVTAQLPARHVEASATRLTFTSETWTAFRTALELRRRGEIMLGWWHSHPVREWCRDCPEEKQRVCAFRGGFLSADDRLLHRTMFPRAYTLALVVNDVADDAPTLSLFGWRRGAIAPRSYHVLDSCSTAASEVPAGEEAHHA